VLASSSALLPLPYTHFKQNSMNIVSLSFSPYELDSELKKATVRKALVGITEKKQKFMGLGEEQR
jgi:hypothetical protein